MKGDHAGVTFEKYIREGLKLMEVTKGRGSQKTESVTEQEKAALRSTVYQLNWLGKDGVPPWQERLLLWQIDSNKLQSKTSSLPTPRSVRPRTLHQ